MTLTPQQIKEFTQAAIPLIQWLNENCHPHCEVNVTNDTATLTEGITHIIVPDFIKD